MCLVRVADCRQKGVWLPSQIIEYPVCNSAMISFLPEQPKRTTDDMVEPQGLSSLDCQVATWREVFLGIHPDKQWILYEKETHFVMLSFKMTVYFLQHNLSYPNLYKEAYIYNIWISGVRYFLKVDMKCCAKSVYEGNSEHFCFIEVKKWNYRNILLF